MSVHSVEPFMREACPWLQALPEGVEPEDVLKPGTWLYHRNPQLQGWIGIVVALDHNVGDTARTGEYLYREPHGDVTVWVSWNGGPLGLTDIRAVRVVPTQVDR